jgi:uncharacterized membrane protein YgcG
MKLALIIMSVLIVVTGAMAYSNLQEAKQSGERADRVNNRLQVLQERLEILESKPDPTDATSWSSSTVDPATGVATVPDEVVAAIAMRIAQNDLALGAIAQGIPASSTSKSDSEVSFTPAQFDQGVRDTLAAVRDEERADRAQRNAERTMERAQERAGRMAEQLGLTGTLAEDFTVLLTEHSVEMSTLWSDARGLDLGRGEMRNFFEQTREEQNEDIENLLNADQYAAYQELPQGGGWGGNFGRRGGGSGGNNNGGGNNSGGGGNSGDSGNHGGGDPGGY